MQLTPAHLGVLFWLCAGLAALVWGGCPERTLAAALLADLAAVRLLPYLSPADAVHWWTLLWDVAILGLMLVLRRRSRPNWLLAAIGFQAIAILAHVPRMLDPGIHRWAYVAATTYAGYLVVLALVAGTVSSARRQGASSDADHRHR